MKIILIFALVVTVISGMTAFAQEEDPVEDPVEDEHVEESDIENDETLPSDEISDDVLDEEIDEELSDEEIEELVEESEEILEEDVESLEDLEGEVIAVTDDVVIVEQSSGEVVSVDRELYERKILATGSAGGKKTVKGQKIESGTISKTGATTNIKTKSGTYSVPSNTLVSTVAGSSMPLADLEDGAKVVVVLDKDGTLIALELLSEELDSAFNTTLVTTVVVIVVLVLLAIYASKRKKKMTV